MSREYIAKILKQLREENNMTADEVGALVGKSGKTVNAWENNRGQPDAEMLIKLCDIYKVNNIIDKFRETPSELTPIIKLTPHEQNVITAYINQPKMQPAVDKLLGVTDETTVYTIPTAARSDDNKSPSTEQMTAEEIDRALSIDEINP